MPHLLHVESSPRKQRSASIEIAHAFIDAWKGHHSNATVDTLDVRSEHQVSYMATWSEMVGIDQQHAIVVEKTLYGPEVDTQGRAAAKAEAVALASTI